ncbi:hypothetical protein BST61_g7611 [Cercospora zeina]
MVVVKSGTKGTESTAAPCQTDSAVGNYGHPFAVGRVHSVSKRRHSDNDDAQPGGRSEEIPKATCTGLLEQLSRRSLDAG